MIIDAGGHQWPISIVRSLRPFFDNDVIMILSNLKTSHHVTSCPDFILVKGTPKIQPVPSGPKKLKLSHCQNQT